MARTRIPEQYEEQRGRILDAAATLFKERGYNATTVDDVAVAIGVTKAAVYYYFSTKADMLIELCHGPMQRAAEMVAKLDSAVDRPVADRLDEFVAGHLALLEADVERWGILFQEAEISKHSSIVKIRSLQRVFERHLQHLIEEGQRTGELAFIDARLATLAILGMCNWAYRWIDKENRAPEEIASVYSTLLRNGLVARTQRREPPNGT